jgi:phospholipid/cholesterol/gamma-HCH transport system substrate-binding protein
MAKGSVFETIVGVGVIGVAAGFLYYAYGVSGRGDTARTYPVDAVFGRIDGVTVGSEVRIAGVKVGAVTQSALDPETYEARVTLSVASNVRLPDDTAAKIVSDGVLGGAHVALEPGGSDVMLAAGDTISITQGSVDLLGLAMQAFSANAGKSGASDSARPAPPPDSADSSGDGL